MPSRIGTSGGRIWSGLSVRISTVGEALLFAAGVVHQLVGAHRADQEERRLVLDLHVAGHHPRAGAADVPGDGDHHRVPAPEDLADPHGSRRWGTHRELAGDAAARRPRRACEDAIAGGGIPVAADDAALAGPPDP